MIDSAVLFLTKAGESLDGARSELANRRYNNCVNRCYYACFQAAISALIQAGAASGHRDDWRHVFVQTEFAELVSRRKIYSAELRDVLNRALRLRQTADYETTPVTEVQARRMLERARVCRSHSAKKGVMVSGE